MKISYIFLKLCHTIDEFAVRVAIAEISMRKCASSTWKPEISKKVRENPLNVRPGLWTLSQLSDN